MSTRALHVISGLTRGGAETFLSRLAPRLRDRGVDSVVVSLTGEDELAEPLRRDGIPVLALGMRTPAPPIREVRRLWRVIDAANPDVVMTWLPHSDLIGGTIARVRGVPVVWNLRSAMADQDEERSHRVLLGVQRRMSRIVPERIVCVSTAALEAHRRLGFDADRMEVIHNGFDTAEFRPDPGARSAVRSELEVGDRTIVIGHVARIDPVKDHATALRAFALFRQQLPDSVLVLCGAGTDSLPNALTDIVRAKGLMGHLRLLGSRSDVPRLTTAFDVAVCSSRFEGLSNALGEAMSCDVPVVSTDSGDARELIGPTGRVVAVGDAEALATALVEILDGGRPSPRERILERFSLDGSVDQYAALLRAVAGST